MARLFAAVLVPDEVKRPMKDFQHSLGNMPMKMKPVEPENMHLTLTFIGEAMPDKFGEIFGELDHICKKHNKFTVKTTEIKLIPSDDHIRVIGVGVESQNDVLENLRRDVAKELGGDSHPCHLTLARVREVSDKNFLKENVSGAKLEIYFEVGKVVLIKSVLRKTGPRYEIIHESDLRS